MTLSKLKTKVQTVVLAHLSIFSMLVFSVAVPVTVNAAVTDGSGCDTSNGSNVTFSGGVDCAQPTGVASNLTGQGGIFQVVANILLFLVGAVAVIMLIIGGLRYVTSNGDQNAVTGAKNTIMYALIGIVVAFLAYAGVNFVVTQLSSGAQGS